MVASFIGMNPRHAHARVGFQEYWLCAPRWVASNEGVRHGPKEKKRKGYDTVVGQHSWLRQTICTNRDTQVSSLEGFNPLSPNGQRVRLPEFLRQYLPVPVMCRARANCTGSILRTLEKLVLKLSFKPRVVCRLSPRTSLSGTKLHVSSRLPAGGQALLENSF